MTHHTQTIIRRNDFSLYIYTAFCLTIHPAVDPWILSVSQLFWIRLLWTWTHKYCFKTLLLMPLNIMPMCDAATQYDSSILNFWRGDILFSTVTIPLHIPISSTHGQVFQFLHSVANPCYFLCFDSIHPDECDVVSHCTFDLHFLSDWSHWIPFFKCLLAIF